MTWTIHCNRCDRSAAIITQEGAEASRPAADVLPGWRLDRERDYDLCPACVGAPTVIDCKVGGMTTSSRNLS